MISLNLGMVWESMLLVAALSLDAFVACLAFGAEKIKVPFSSALVIDLVCTGILAVSLFLGSAASEWILPGTAAALSFLTLLALGLIRLFESFFKRLINRICANPEGVMFRFRNVRFFLQVCADSIEADSNHSKWLSPGEAVSLAAALSLDGLAAGFGAGIAAVSCGQSILFSLVFNLAAVLGGCAIGGRLARRSNLDLGWLSGFVLILLGASKLFP